MKKLISILALTIFLVLSITAFAQEQQPEMADTMRANGKIYVVVGVILIVLVGLFIYLFSIERKVKKLEQKIDDNR